MSAGPRPGAAALRLSPVVGAAVGAAGGLTYWGAAGIWPSSIAVVLAMLIGAALDPQRDILPPGRPMPSRDAASSREGAWSPPWGWVPAVLIVLLKYDSLMALSAAKLPYALPPNVSLGIVMVGGHAVARALAVSVPAVVGAPAPRVAGLSTVDLGIALVIGFLPAALIGVPGLAGGAVAIAARMGLVAWLRRRPGGEAMALGVVRQAAEIAFYLGALGAWSFI